MGLRLSNAGEISSGGALLESLRLCTSCRLQYFSTRYKRVESWVAQRLDLWIPYWI